MTDIKPIGSFWDWICGRPVLFIISVTTATLYLLALNLFALYILGFSIVIFDIPLVGLFALMYYHTYLREKEAQKYYIEHNFEPRHGRFYKL